MEETASSWPELKARPLISGAVLIGIGGMAALAGLIVGGTHVFAATRKWVREMEVPPSEVAKAKWAQARAAASAGASAWRAIPADDAGSSASKLHSA
jgi:hypothetical protein